MRLDYLFLDVSFFRMHPGSPAEPVLAAWGITTEGKPAFVGLAPRNILAKIRAGMQAEIKDAYWAIFDTEDLTTPAGFNYCAMGWSCDGRCIDR